MCGNSKDYLFSDNSTSRKLLTLLTIITSILLIIGLCITPAFADSWTQVNQDGFGDKESNAAIDAMAEYNSKLYVSTNAGNPIEEPGRVWQYDGNSWKQISEPGFGDTNNLFIESMAVYKSKLYAGTVKDQIGCEVWAYDGSTWTQANTDGFGQGPGLCEANSMAVYDGRLYVGCNCATADTGCQVWRYDGSSWEQANTDGFDGDKNNWYVASLEVFNGNLYAGTGRDWYEDSGGCEVWRYNGSNWTQVNANGFGNYRNQGANSMAVYDSTLYVGTSNSKPLGESEGCKVYRYNGTNWTQVNTDGFGNETNTSVQSMSVYDSALYATTSCEVWKYGGNKWTMANTKGFGDSNNTSALLCEYGTSLYAGTSNDTFTGGTGCEIWRTSAEPPTPTFYLAEGYTGSGFQEYLCIGNASNTDTTANVTFMYTNGQNGTGDVTIDATQTETYDVPANSRKTVDINSAVGSDKEVSIKVESDCTEMVVERPIYFNYNGIYPGGHDVVAASAPNTEWYFAEGTTLPGFDEYITVQNPNNETANLTFRYMVEGEGETVEQGTVGANSRGTFTVRNQIGDGKTGVSLKLESDIGVVAERPLYFNYQGLASNNWKGGHCVVGTNSPADTWYFAEGTTRPGFEEWLCIQNPSDQQITVTANYVLGEGQGDPVEKTYDIPAEQRKTISVNNEIGADKDVSTTLTCDTPFIAERPLYFMYNGVWDGGHDVLGANDFAETWFFAEGYTGDNFQEYLCIQNPGNENAAVTITYYPEQGTPIVKQHTVNANRRYTVDVNADAGAGLSISAKVESTVPVVVERPMYFNYNGVWPGGHDVVGYVPSGS